MSNGPFDLAALLRGRSGSFSPLSDKHTVVADIPDDLPLANGDPMATDIIVGQLLENAFKYSPEGGTVTVRARAVGPTDRGGRGGRGHRHRPGDHERIFERFVQGETGDRRRFGGIGLGLYIVRRLARAQDGRCRHDAPRGRHDDAPDPPARSAREQGPSAATALARARGARHR